MMCVWGAPIRRLAAGLAYHGGPHTAPYSNEGGRAEAAAAPLLTKQQRWIQPGVETGLRVGSEWQWATPEGSTKKQMKAPASQPARERGPSIGPGRKAEWQAAWHAVGLCLAVSCVPAGPGFADGCVEVALKIAGGLALWHSGTLLSAFRLLPLLLVLLFVLLHALPWRAWPWMQQPMASMQYAHGSPGVRSEG